MKYEPTSHRAFTEAEPHDALSGPEPQVDLAVLSSLEDDDEESKLIVELIDLYHENGTRQVDEIKAAAAKMDGASVKQSAHALKGSSLTMGASQVADLCQQLETPQHTASEITSQLAGELETAFASAAFIFAAERQRRLVPAFA
jgi:HPt (histidine-containing phosphotransfer) domain-containing protein